MRRTLAAAIGAVSVAAVLSGAGLAAASGRPAGSHIEHFQSMTTSATSNRFSLIATGVFTAGGVHVPTGATTDIFKFPGGTFGLKHHAVSSKQTLNGRTCLFTISERGTYKISGGTGKYAGISGSGTYVASIMAVFARNSKGKCRSSAPPPTFQLIINGHGPVKL
jgi:hypothetical protein